MLAAYTDLTRYMYMPSKGITITISGDTTSGDTLSTGDARRYLQDAEARVAAVLGDVPVVYTRISTAYSTGTTVTVDTMDTDDWNSTGYIYFSGRNVAYTGITTTSFTGCSCDYGIPASPVGTFVIQADEAGLVGYDELKGYEAELYRRLEVICQLAAYNIWVTRFPADELPKVITDWKRDAERYLAKKGSGTGYVRP